jgi:predicted nucleotidyltransferase
MSADQREKLKKETLEAITRVLVSAVNPDRVVLFGSRARGDARHDSDLDLLIVEKESFGPHRSRSREIRRIRRILSDFRIPKDILVYSVDEVAKWRNSVNHILAKCLREGKVLYARS